MDKKLIQKLFSLKNRVRTHLQPLSLSLSFDNPSWQALDIIRQAMCEEGVLLTSSVVKHETKIINAPMQAPQTLVTVSIEYTWHDGSTGEQLSPLTMAAAAVADIETATEKAMDRCEWLFYVWFLWLPTVEAETDVECVDIVRL